MTDLELEVFRLKFRMSVLEKIALYAGVVMPVLSRELSVEESLAAARTNLEKTRETAMQAYGPHFQDAGLADLYSSEISELVDSMLRHLDGIAEKLRAG